MSSKIITKALSPYLIKKDNNNSPFNYERFLCIDKAAYLDAFIKDELFGPFELEIQTSSRCNLNCTWCIGEQVQQQKRVKSLPNSINVNNVDKLVDGILQMRENVLSLDTVKFSGFIGDPLLNRDATLIAIKRLHEAGVRVGLFTNGTLMNDDTWDVLSKIDYVHISLDAGPESFYPLKEHYPIGTASSDTFYSVIDYIKGLNSARKKAKSNLKINIGYVIVEGNHHEIFTAAKIVKEAGADMIRFKFDISSKYDVKTPWLAEAFSQIEKAKQELNSTTFSVQAIHNKDTVKNNAHTTWSCSRGCYLQYFMATIGSDANMYMCDHNTMPGAISFGNSINSSFYNIWNSDRHKYLASGVRFTCQSDVCPPFGNSVNLFLDEVVKLKNKYGAHAVIDALNEFRKES